MRKFVEPDVADNPLYHDTWKLLKKYRDVVWSLELSVQHVRTKFEIEYGPPLRIFWIQSIWLALIWPEATSSIMPNALNAATKCSSCWIPQSNCCVPSTKTVRHITGCCTTPSSRRSSSKMLRKSSRPCAAIRDISFRTYYRKRREALKPSVPSLGLYLQGQFRHAGAVLPRAKIIFRTIGQIIGTIREQNWHGSALSVQIPMC